MATYLISRGFIPKLLKKGTTKTGHPIGAWEFPGDDGVAAAVHQYNEGLAKVEPRKFHQTLTNVRRELFQFLEIR